MGRNGKTGKQMKRVRNRRRENQKNTKRYSKRWGSEGIRRDCPGPTLGMC